MNTKDQRLTEQIKQNNNVWNCFACLDCLTGFFTGDFSQATNDLENRNIMNAKLERQRLAELEAKVPITKQISALHVV